MRYWRTPITDKLPMDVKNGSFEECATAGETVAFNADLISENASSRQLCVAASLAGHSRQTSSAAELDSSERAQLRHDGARVCCHCGSLVRRTDWLHAHMRRHLQYKPACCPLCPYKGYDVSDVRRHAIHAHASKQPHLLVSFQKQQELEMQVEEMIANSREIAANSPFRSKELDDDEMHFSDNYEGAAAEESPKFVNCLLCKDSFDAKPHHVIAHLRWHLEFAGYRCPFCGPQTLDDSAAVTTYQKFSELSAHVRESHSTLPTLEPELTNAASCLAEQLTLLAERAFGSSSLHLPCALCGQRVAFRLDECRVHSAVHAGHYAFRCVWCQEPFVDQAALIEHAKCLHPNSILKLQMQHFPCDMRSAKETFLRCFTSLAPEVLDRDSEKPGSSGSDQIGRYSGPVIVITPEQADVQCALCLVRTDSNNLNLVQHSKLHLGTKPLQCNLCPFRHYSIENLRSHCEKVHPTQPVSVSIRAFTPEVWRQILQMIKQCFGNELVDRRGERVLEQIARDDEQLSTSDTAVSHLQFPTNVVAQSGRPLLFNSLQSGTALLRSLVSGSVSTAAQGIRQGNPVVSSPSPRPNLSGELSVGKKMCSLCQVYIANNPSSFENHACKHLDYKPFCCFYCQYSSYIRGKVTRHIQQVHHGLAVKINHQPVAGIKHKINQVKMQCFPFLVDTGLVNSALDGGESPSNQFHLDNSNSSSANQMSIIRCGLCSELINRDQNSQDSHLQKHINPRKFCCPICHQIMDQLVLAKNHLRLSHPDQRNMKLICVPPDGLAGLERVQNLCFPSAGADLDTSDNNSLRLLDDDDDDEMDVQYDNAMASALPVSLDDSLQNDDHETFSARDDFGDVDDSSEVLMIDDDCSQTGVDNNMHQCVLCAQSFPANSASFVWEAHARAHAAYTPYQCGHCSYKAALEFDIKQHIVDVHPGASLKVLYQPEREQLNRWLRKCFPLKYLNDINLAGNNPDGTNNAVSVGHGAYRKLICQVCMLNIADNPKSVGIHVKNHLNYKPYQCPFCKYQSCEQSKARRHIEHVHGKSADLLSVQEDADIKEKIIEMKQRCFPNLGHMPLADVYPDGDSGGSRSSPSGICLQSGGEYADPVCLICQRAIPPESMDYHVRTHMAKPFKCIECQLRFTTNDQRAQHYRDVHPGFQGGSFLDQLQDEDDHFLKTKRRCFPDTLSSSDVRKNGLYKDSDYSADSGSIHSLLMAAASNRIGNQQYAGQNIYYPGMHLEAGKVQCKICDQVVASNQNSMDVHCKNHLNYKNHQCAYCQYRSCIPGKVKRHVETVHRDRQMLMHSQTHNTPVIKQIFGELKLRCFPLPGDALLSRTELVKELERLRVRLQKEIDSIELDQNNQNNNNQYNSIMEVDDDDIDSRRARRCSGSSDAVIGDAASDCNSVNGLTVTGTAQPFHNNFVQRLQCQLCSMQVADNPSSIGLHVRNHLGYKPFLCRLCDYRSCIQAKVKRHLKNVHKMDNIQDNTHLQYNPEPEIRQRVTEMKLKCFPRIQQAVDSAMDAEIYLNGAINLTSSPSPVPSLLDDNSLLNNSGDSSFVDSNQVVCSLCSIKVPIDVRVAHAESHGHIAHYRCSACDAFTHIREGEVKQHMKTCHAEHPMKIVMLPPSLAVKKNAVVPGDDKLRSLSNVSDWLLKCFPESGVGGGGREANEIDGLEEEEEEEVGSEAADDSSDDDISLSVIAGMAGHTANSNSARYVCRLCKLPVSMYASSLYTHVKNHLNYKPYACGYCDYRSPVKSKVRRHSAGAHKDSPLKLFYRPLSGVEKRIMDMKQKCFPDALNLQTQANNRLPCNLCHSDVADTPLSKSTHAKNHLDSKPFHCGYCHYRSCLRGETRRHVSRQHCGQPMDIKFVDKEQASSEQVEEMISICFEPTFAAQTAVTDSADTFNCVYSTPATLQTAGSGGSESGDDLDAELGTLYSNATRVAKSGPTSITIKLGQATREWKCKYCAHKAYSKYQIKQHCLFSHPGLPVDVKF